MISRPPPPSSRPESPDYEILHRISSAMPNLFFVQVGAMDGVTFDPIQHLVKGYRWRGLLIEPIPELFNDLLDNYRGHDKLTFANVAVGESEGTRVMHYIPKDVIAAAQLPRWCRGVACEDPARVIIKERGQRLNETREWAHSRTVLVEARPLSALLQSYCVDQVNLLFIDAEGFDLEILKTLDFQRYKPLFIQIEISHMADEKLSAAQHFLKDHGYDVGFLRPGGQDIFAIQKDFDRV